ncbi:MAG: YdbH domain-containing protein [Proteobacteria bacterium]|nr:YdbH domain-containing protein [Pseudomonadota bacterium]
MRFLARLLIFLSVLILVLGPGVFLARDTLAPGLASWIARSGFGLTGLGHLDFQIVYLGAGRLALRNVSAGGGAITAEAIDATYQLSDLRQGRLASLSVNGLTMRAGHENGRLDLGPLDALLSGQAPSGSRSPWSQWRLPMDRLILKDARALLETPQGALELTFNISAEERENGVLSGAGDAVVKASSTTVAGGGVARARLRFEGGRELSGAFRINGKISQGSARFQQIALGSGGGEIVAEIGGADRNSGQVSLRLDEGRIGQATLPSIVLEAVFRGDAGSASLRLSDPAHPAQSYTLAAAIDGGTRERLQVRLTGDGAVGVPYRLLQSVLNLPIDDLEGTAGFRINGTVPGPISNFASRRFDADALRGAIATGGAEIALSSVVWEGRPRRMALSGRLSAIAGSGRLELRAADTWRLEAPMQELAALAEKIPEAAHGWLDSGLVVALERGSDTASALVDFTGKTPKARLSGTLTGLLGESRRGTLSGSVTLGSSTSKNPGRWAADIDVARLRLSGFELAGSALRTADASCKGQVGPGYASGRFTVRGQAGIANAGTSGDVALDLAGRILTAGGATRAVVERLDLAVAKVRRAASGLSILQPVRLSQPPDTAAELIVTRQPGKPTHLDIRGALAVEPIILHLSGDGEGRQVQISPGRIDGRFKDTGRPGGETLEVAIHEAGFDDPGLPVIVSGMSGTASLRLGGKTTEIAALDIKIPSIAERHRPAWFVPLMAKIAGSSPGPGADLALRGEIAAQSGILRWPVAGVMRQRGGSGQLSLARSTLQFGPEDLTLAEVSPALSEHIESAEGAISIEVRHSWPDAQTDDAASLVIGIDDLTVHGADFGIEKANGDIAFATLSPIATDGPRTLTMQAMTLGVPIENPRISFSLDGLDAIVVTDLSGGFAGGTVSARDVRITPDQPTTAAIEVEGVSASALAGLAKVDGLQAEGALSGSLPVTWTPGVGLAVVGGHLTAQGPGTVRYQAGDRDAVLRQSGEQVGLMLDALSDFNYTTLGLTLDGRPSSGYRIALALEGANPNLYDGYPVRFNLDLSGQLDDIIKTGYRTYTLPTRVQDVLLRNGADQ